MTWDELNDREHAELLHRVLARGFTENALTDIYIAELDHAKKAGGKLLTLQEFFGNVHRGDYDWLLRDQDGNSFS